MTLLKKKTKYYKAQILWNGGKSIALRASLKNLMKDIFCGMILIIYLFFFYCQSLFDCWKNQVIRGLKSHHKTFVNLTQGV